MVFVEYYCKSDVLASSPPDYDTVSRRQNMVDLSKLLLDINYRLHLQACSICLNLNDMISSLKDERYEDRPPGRDARVSGDTVDDRREWECSDTC